MRVATSVSLRRASVPPAKTRSMLPIVTTSPSCSTADSTRGPLTNVPLMLRWSTICVPPGLGTSVAWWREASTSGMTMSLSVARPILMPPAGTSGVLPGRRILSMLVARLPSLGAGCRCRTHLRGGGVEAGDRRRWWHGGRCADRPVPLRGAGGRRCGARRVHRLRLRGLRRLRIRGPGRRRWLRARVARRWRLGGPGGARPLGNRHLLVCGGVPAEPWWRPTSKVRCGPSGLPMLTPMPSAMSTMGTRWPLTYSPLRLPLSMATQRP